MDNSGYAIYYRAYRAIESLIEIMENPVVYIDLLKKIEANDFKLIDKT